jgi:hypothetical protein
MPEVHTEIVVDAPAARVFAVLADASRWPEWNQLFRVVRGELAADANFVGKIAIAGLPITFHATVTRYEPDRALAWKGPRFWLLQRIAVGEHYFELERRGDDCTHLVHGERFDGILPNLDPIWRQLEPRLTKAYSRFNEALKARATARR